MMVKKRKRAARRSTAPEPRDPISAFAAHFSWRWLVGVVSGVSVLLGAIIAWNHAHPIVEPWTPASSGYVRTYADTIATKKVEPLAKIMGDYEAFRIEQTLETTKLGKIQLEQNLIAAKKEYAANPESAIVRDALNRLTRQLTETDKRIEDYQAALFARKNAR